ncbi:ubiquinol-cytochrome c reductase iron-sulfur subunit [Streptomyces sp. WAC06614]|uniref:QcrA and Rieske domain-containing protein n=1 Tax=Streptomyces sp. WAC06614 TaxID=2487416 RepID=UPI000F785846|nr:Rieske (2Fe-2S) protein [Streptomyces sp. WAC06614]RSS80206.1 Rieske (2Fe-2S) protein [Streptomyces sp. WAC06614]
MSVTEQAPGAGGDGGPEAGTDEDRARLRDRIGADSLTTRRDYLRIVATVSGGLAIGGIGVASGILHRHGDSESLPPARKVADQLLPGRSVAFRFPGDEDRALAVRLADGTLVGYSAVCTHLACAVLWREDRGPDGELYCPCHEGVFDARTGEVTAGPPPRPLPRIFLTEQPDGSVWAIATARSGETAKDALCRQFRDTRPEMAQRLGCPGAAGAPAGHLAPDRRRT